MKLLIDVAKAVADGMVTPAQGEALQRAAAADTMTLAINILLSIGVLAVSGGVLALQPTIALVVVLGVALAVGGHASVAGGIGRHVAIAMERTTADDEAWRGRCGPSGMTESAGTRRVFRAIVGFADSGEVPAQDFAATSICRW